MNSFVLMATVIRQPELRYTSENQIPVCQFLVEFPALREDAPSETLKVVGWNNLANTINDSYKPGDRLMIEGRLQMDTVERQEGFKEKRAELIASRIHKIDTVPDFVAPTPSTASTQPSVGEFAPSTPSAAPSAVSAPVPANSDLGENLDDIPF